MPQANGFSLKPGFLSGPEQRLLIERVVDVIKAAPLYRPTMPKTGKPLSVAMTNCGPLGWLTDRDGGYRYQATHPDTGRPWPPIPEMVLEIWRDLSGYGALPEACLVNHYRPGARMGLHRDSDEQDFSAPLVSVSLGDSAQFRLGGERRRDPTQSFRLSSGDVLVMGGPSRRFFHGVDRIFGGSSRLLSRHADIFPEGGRINLTLRRVTVPEQTDIQAI